jgi:erythromycin esterase
VLRVRCLTFLLALVPTLAAGQGIERLALEGLADQEPGPCSANLDALPRLDLLHVQSGQLPRGAAACFGLQANAGEFIRMSVASGDPYVRVRILEPRSGVPLVVSWGTDPFALEVPAWGVYFVELSVPPVPQIPLEAVSSFTLQVHEWRSAAVQSGRREDLRRDVRTVWLSEHATPIRSLDPSDDDFSDLDFLRTHLRGVRVVLLGEEHHGAGSTFGAKTRLIRFLHEELGFNVLAFESGIFSMSEAWRALLQNVEPRAAFSAGAPGVWARSEQLTPLLEYLAQSVHSDRPLELAGVGSQFTGLAGPLLLSELRALLQRHAIESPLADEQSDPSQVFAGVLDGRFARDRDFLPSSDQQDAAIASVLAAATQVAHVVSGRDGAFWGQVLRSAAVQLGLYLDGLRPDASVPAYARGRDRQMADNLVWLATEHYADQKLIVWAHNVHVMRNPAAAGHLIPDQGGFTMGHGAWERLGRQSFAIGFTSYGGRTHNAHLPDEIEQQILEDQDSAFEFEELMDAAGYEQAFVDLRETSASNTWLDGAFWARPLFLKSGLAPWGEAFDGLFFIRTQEPSRATR